jgi:hypothetical protein
MYAKGLPVSSHASDPLYVMGDADAVLPAPLADVEEPPIELALVNEAPEEKAEAAAPTDVGPS